MLKLIEKGVSKTNPSIGIGLRTESCDGEPERRNILSIHLGKKYWYFTTPYILKHSKKWKDLSKYEWANRDGYWESINREYSFKSYYHADDLNGVFIHYGLQDEDDRKNYKFKLFRYPWENGITGRQVLKLNGDRACSSACFDSYYEKHDYKVAFPYVIKDDIGNDKFISGSLNPKEYFGESISISDIVSERVLVDPFDGKEISSKIWITKSFFTRGTNKFFRFIFGYLFRMKTEYCNLNIEFSEEYGKGKETWKGGTLVIYQPIDNYGGDIDSILYDKGYVTKS